MKGFRNPFGETMMVSLCAYVGWVWMTYLGDSMAHEHIAHGHEIESIRNHCEGID